MPLDLNLNDDSYPSRPAKIPEIRQTRSSNPAAVLEQYEYERSCTSFASIARYIHGAYPATTDSFLDSRLDNGSARRFVLVEPPLSRSLMEVRPSACSAWSIRAARFEDTRRHSQRPAYHRHHEVKEVYPHVPGSIEHYFQIYKD